MKQATIEHTVTSTTVTVVYKYSLHHMTSIMTSECFGELSQENYFELSVISWFTMS